MATGLIVLCRILVILSYWLISLVTICFILFSEQGDDGRTPVWLARPKYMQFMRDGEASF
jgi:hypothetical protein